MTELGITASPSEPFFESDAASTSTSSVDQWGPVSLAGRSFLIDWLTETYERRNLELLREQTNPDQDESPLQTPEVWRRSVESVKEGAGQAKRDKPGSSGYRFQESWNVDCWEEWGFSLLHAVDEVESIPTVPIHAVTYGTNGLAVSYGTTLLRWDDFNPLASPTSTTMAGVADMLASDGSTVYAKIGTAVDAYPFGGGAPSTFATLAGTDGIIGYAKGFLLATVANVLYDISSGTPVVVYTAPMTSFRWVDITEGDAGVYLLGGAGDRWLIHRAPIKDDATTIDPPPVVAQLPDGEIGTALDSYLGYLLIGTSNGARMATADQSGYVTYGRLIPSDAPVRSFEGQDRFVWYGGGVQPDGYTGLGRLDLSQFTSPLTPAWASDLNIEADGGVSFVATRNGVRVFLVEGSGLYVESDDLAEEGFLTLGDLTFNSVDRKVGLYAQISHEPLAGEIDFDAARDGGAFTSVRSNTTAGSTTFGNIELDSTGFIRFNPRFTLHRDAFDPMTGPTIDRFELRAIPLSGMGSQWLVPLMVGDAFDYEGSTQARDPAHDYDFLVNLVDSPTPFTYAEGDKSYRVHATDYRWRPRQVNRDGKALVGTFYITLKELR